MAYRYVVACISRRALREGVAAFGTRHVRTIRECRIANCSTCSRLIRSADQSRSGIAGFATVNLMRDIGLLVAAFGAGVFVVYAFGSIRAPLWYRRWKFTRAERKRLAALAPEQMRAVETE